MENWPQIENLLGDELISFILGDRSTEHYKVQQDETAEWLSRTFGNLAELARTVNHDFALEIYGLLRAEYGDTGIAAIDYWRDHCGLFVFDTMTEKQRVDSILLQMAADVYPFLLIPRKNTLHGRVSTILWDHKMQHSLWTAILNPDEPLRKAFPGAPSPGQIGDSFKGSEGSMGIMEVRSSLVWSTGTGGIFTLSSFPECIINSAVAGYFPAADLEGFLRCVRRSLGDARRLAEGQEVELPAVLEGYGLDLPPHQGIMELGASGAVIRRRTPVDRLSDWVWESAQDREDQGILLIMPVRVRLLARTADLPTEEWYEKHIGKSPTELWEGVERRAQKFQLSVALSGSGDRRGFTISSMTIPIPLFSGGGRIARPWAHVAAGMAGVKPLMLTRDLADIISKTWDSVSVLPKTLDIAVSMIVSATTDRLFARDAFIDLMIAWENMLGADSETTFKLCASTCWLLEPNDEERRFKLYKELSDMYRARSLIVHGSRATGRIKSLIDNIEATRNRAFKVVTSCLTALLASPEVMNAELDERVKRLILQAKQI